MGLGVRHVEQKHLQYLVLTFSMKVWNAIFVGST